MLKIACPSCSTDVALRGFRTVADELEIACGECGVLLRVTAADGSVRIIDSDVGKAPEPPDVEELPVENQELAGVVMSCPKCGQPQDEEEACRRCGLLRANMSDYQEDQQVPEVLAALWAAAEKNYDEDSAHDAFLQEASRTQQLAFAARVYRRRSDQRAVEMLQQIVDRTQATLEAMAEGSSASSSRVRWTAVTAIVLFLTAAILGLWLWTKWSSSAPAEVPGKRPTSTLN